MLSLRLLTFYILTGRACGTSQCAREDEWCKKVYQSLDADDDDPSLVLLQNQATKVTPADEMDDILMEEIESCLFEESPGHTAVKVLQHQGSKKIKAGEPIKASESKNVKASLSLDEDDSSLNLLQTQAAKVTKADETKVDETTDSVMELIGLEEELLLGHTAVKILKHKGARKIKAGESNDVKVNASTVVNTTSKYDTFLEHPVTCLDCDVALLNESDLPGLSLLQTQAAKVIKDDLESNIVDEVEMASDSNISSDLTTEVNTTYELERASDSSISSDLKTEVNATDEVEMASYSNISNDLNAEVNTTDEVEAPSDSHISIDTNTAQPNLGWSGPFFFDVSTMDWYQLFIVTCFYGYLLYIGSNMIGDGAEQLTFFPSVSGIVGSVVVPVLGAVPDSMMVLFSGLGPDAQQQVSTGVGALAGSTVMLLTFPWFVVIMTGSVPLGKDGKADYKRSNEPAELFTSGVTFGSSLNMNARIMVITSLSFLIIQIPALSFDHAGVPVSTQASHENKAAGIGFIVSLFFFFSYVLACYRNANDDTRLGVILEAMESGKLGLPAVLAHLSDDDELKNKTALKKILWKFFQQFDTDGSQKLELNEFTLLLKKVGFNRLGPDRVKSEFEFKGTKKDALSFEDFCVWAEKFRDEDHRKRWLAMSQQSLKIPSYESEEEEEEIPEAIANLPVEQQARAMLLSSIGNMVVGTILVLLFSDPAVDVFTEWGKRLGISSFYVSFLLAPFASNASELLVAYSMALKKNTKAITMSFESLVGAACMNNTLCLAVFFALVYFKNLAWQFKAETLGILFVQWTMAILILSNTTQRKVVGYLILSLYPICLIMVAVMENIIGWD